MKDSLESSTKYVESLIELISQRDPHLASQIAESINKYQDDIKRTQCSMSFLKAVPVAVSQEFNDKALDFRHKQNWLGLIDHCQHWLQIEPGKVLALYSLGVGYEKMSLLQEALQTYQKVINLQSDHCLAWIKHAEVNELMGRNEESIKSYLEALRLRPDDALTWFMLSRVYEKQGCEEEVIEAFNKFKHFAEDEAITWFNQGVNWILEGKKWAAWERVEDLYKIDPGRGGKLIEIILNYM